MNAADEAAGQTAPIQVRAAGCVVWRPGPAGPEVALIHRPRYDDWSFPKGKLDPGEGYVQAAVREVREETGYPVVLGRRLPTQVYDVSFGGAARMKRVKYWAAQAAVDSDFQPNSEVDRLEWLPLAAARDRLTRQTDRDLLLAFRAAPVDTVPVLLLRHAEAVPRKRWDGEELERPLTGRGRDDAEALVPMLAAYGQAALTASPFARCVATLKPSARSAGAAMALEPALAEGADPDAGRAWLREALKSGHTTIACTHRPVLPELLAESPLGQAVHSGRRALAPAEAWVLHARDGHVVAIDRLKL
ncbi:8-oxo-dGTP pyrophosphatase MutT (NUDIX family)/phosphohistidine phosphatase SixA [Catenulispora sp. MAP12-49]|uniref:NUDIX hydrolase n=1 Tax=unclassified Catenulispora TaxID=414885 RepID=UPI0035177A68